MDYLNKMRSMGLKKEESKWCEEAGSNSWYEDDTTIVSGSVDGAECDAY